MFTNKINKQRSNDKNHKIVLNELFVGSDNFQAVSPNPLARYLARGVVVMFVLTGLWISFAHVDIVVSSEGKISHSANVKTISLPNHYSIESIAIKDGDSVAKGQAILKYNIKSELSVLQKAQFDSKLNGLKEKVSINKELLKKLQTLAAQDKKESDKVLPIEEEIKDTSSEIVSYKKMRWQRYSSEYKSIQSNLRVNAAKQAEAEALISKLNQSLPIMKKRLKTLKELHKKKYVTETEVQDATMARIDNEQNLAVIKQRYQILKEEAVEIDLKLATYIAIENNHLLEEIADQNREITLLEKELQIHNRLKKTKVIYAPIAGRIKNLNNIIDTKISEYKKSIIQIIPDKNVLEVQLMVEEKDIGNLRENMTADIKLTSSPYLRKSIPGRISLISREGVIDEAKGLSYKIIVQLKQDVLNIKGQSINLEPGMTITATIPTGKQRLFNRFKDLFMVAYRV